MKKLRFNIGGMTCVVCANTCLKAIRGIEGVRAADVNFATGKAAVEYDESVCSEEQIAKAVSAAGYKPVMNAEKAPVGKRDFYAMLAMAVLGGALLLFAMLPMLGVPYPRLFSPEGAPITFATVQLILCIPVVTIGWGFYYRGVRNLVKLQPNMDSLVAVSTLAALCYSLYGYATVVAGDAHGVHNLYFESVAVILALISLGKYMEKRSLARTGKAIEKLTGLTPKLATVIRDGETLVIDSAEVVAGDTVAVKPGEIFCCDGVLIKGETGVDESMLTGESLPVDKKEGDPVTGGTVNGSGSVLFRATSVGEETKLSRIIRMVEEAQNSKAPIARLADKVSKIFVPVVIALAIVAALVWWGVGKDGAFVIKIFVSVLVIACPCALGLATPTAIITGTGRGAQGGILFKNAEALELLSRVRRFVFDKTGTVTEGKPVVTEIYAADGDETALTEIAAACEADSEHPLALAVLQYAQNRGVGYGACENFEAIAGFGLRAVYKGRTILCGKENLLAERGVDLAPLRAKLDELYAKGRSIVLLAADGKALGVLAIADTVKKEAAEVVARLKKDGGECILLTGDNRRTAEEIAREAGIETVIAEVLPQDKAREVERLKASGSVAMVGDGINDAPALVTATVGIAVGGGSDIAIESADVVLVGGELTGVARGFELSRATVRNIKQNLFWAFIYNILGIPVAMGLLYPFTEYLLSPMLAALAMSLSSVSVVANALRLGLYRLDKRRPKAQNNSRSCPLSAREAVAAARTTDNRTDAPASAKESEMKEFIFKVEGMSCAHCENAVRRALLAVDGVTEASASATEKKAYATARADVARDALAAAIEGADYRVAE